MKEEPSPPERPLSADRESAKSSSFDIDEFENSARARFSIDLADSQLSLSLPESPKKPSKQLLRRILIISGLILLWYTFSLVLSLYNKWMFAPAHLNFPFPLFVTSMHMLMQFILSLATLWLFPSLRPKREDYLSPLDYAFVFYEVNAD